MNYFFCWIDWLIDWLINDLLFWRPKLELEKIDIFAKLELEKIKLENSNLNWVLLK